jgi:hypothetical protein
VTLKGTEKYLILRKIKKQLGGSSKANFLIIEVCILNFLLNSINLTEKHQKRQKRHLFLKKGKFRKNA